MDASALGIWEYTRFLDDTKADDRDAGIAMGIEMLKLCSELRAFNPPTPGMAREIAAARKMEIPVRGFDSNGLEVNDHE